MRLHTRILIGGVCGIALGAVAHVALGPDHPALAAVLHHLTVPAGQIFLRLLFMLVIPLIASALVLGVSAMGDPRTLGRVGGKFLFYTVFITAVTVVTGLVLVNLIRPGVGLPPELRARIIAGAAQRSTGVAKTVAPAPGVDMIVQIVPTNPFKSAAEGDLLGVMFFSLLIGVGLALTPTPATQRLREAVEGLFEICMRLIRMIIELAPFGVAALLFNLTAQLGYEVLLQLARYVGVVLLALGIQQFVVFPLIIRFLARRSPIAFFRAIQEAMITAFSTSSTNATLPTTLRVAESELHLPPTVSRFVLTLGAALNHNGSALYEGVTVLFLAQFYGVDLSLPQQATVVMVCILGGIGTAGVPSGSIPVIALILGMFGIPMEGIGLIIGVDRLLDMCRTTLNVTGDLVAAAVVARGEPAGDSRSDSEPLALPTPV
jgi:Na+/H+-dicarboxylate symporter